MHKLWQQSGLLLQNWRYCPHCKARFVGEKKPPPRWDQVPLTGAKKVVVTVLAILFAIGMIIYQIKKRT